jgi:hypothetical protein
MILHVERPRLRQAGGAARHHPPGDQKWAERSADDDAAGRAWILPATESTSLRGLVGIQDGWMPGYQPRAAFDMVARFLENRSYTSSAKGHPRA